MTLRPQTHSQSHSEYPASASDGSHHDSWPPLADFITSNVPNAPHADPRFNNGGLNRRDYPKARGVTEPTTTIHGGTFIGGNVNNVSGVAGMFSARKKDPLNSRRL
jgi:hypothetical protein